MAKTKKPDLHLPGNRSIAEILAMKEPTVQTVRVCLSADLAARISEARQEMTIARNMVAAAGEGQSPQRAERLVQAEQELEALQVEADPVLVDFKFQSIGSANYDALLADHPPSPKQKKDHKAALQDAQQSFKPLEFNVDTFPPALTAAASLEPKMTDEDTAEMWNSPSWNQAELMALFAAAVGVQTTFRSV